MKRCEHLNCRTMVKDQYHFCWVHRKDKYKDTCYKHGKTDFQEGICLKCKKMRTPMYRIHKRKNKYYFNKNKRPLPKDYFMKPYYKILTHRTVAYQKKYIGRITKGPGTYAIFVRDKRSKLGIGKCLYVGQSTDVARRAKEHQEAIKIATKDLRRVKRLNKRIYLIDKRKLKVPLLYYRLAQYGLPKVKFVRLHKIEKSFWKKLTLKEALQCLTFFEQLGMDTFKPQFNTIAARPTSYEMFKK